MLEISENVLNVKIACNFRLFVVCGVVGGTVDRRGCGIGMVTILSIILLR